MAREHAAVMTAGSPATAFGLNAASFAASALLIGSVSRLGGTVRQHRPGVRTRRSRLNIEVFDGWSEVTRTPGLSTVMTLLFVMYAVRGAEMILLVLIADDKLGLGSAGVGLLLGAIGLGAVAALPFANRIADSRNPGLVMTASVVMTGLPLIALSLTSSPLVALVVLVVLGAGVVAFELLSTVLLQRLTQRDRLGRVFGLVGSASNGGKLAGAIFAPAAVAVLGREVATAACGVALAVAALASTPRLRALTALTADRRRVLEPRVEVLASLGVFEGASRQTLEMLAAYVTVEQVPAGFVVIRQGETADDLYVIRDGTFVASVDGRHVNTIGAGQWFGEIGLLHRRPRTATVTASTAATIWRIPGTVFLDALFHGASEPTALVEVMAERLARTS
jgi:MFS family permease